MDDNFQYRVIFVVGAPGAGKNTQCDLLVEKYKFTHFGAGDLLREEAKKDSVEGEKIRKIMNEGKIVPSEITCNLIKNKMNEVGKESIFIIDGYPRSEGNFNAFCEVFANKFEIICTLYLTCNEEQCINRILSRSESSGRSDDNIETLRKRFKTFYEESLPVIELLKKIGPILEIDATKPPSEVFDNISVELTKYLTQ